MQELNIAQSENLLSLKSEISIKLNETDQHAKSLLSNMEDRLTTDTEKKITQLGKKVFHEKMSS